MNHIILKLSNPNLEINRCVKIGIAASYGFNYNQGKLFPYELQFDKYMLKGIPGLTGPK